MRKYLYQVSEESGVCTTPCHHFPEITIASVRCEKCEHFVEELTDEKRIVCSKGKPRKQNGFTITLKGTPFLVKFIVKDNKTVCVIHDGLNYFVGRAKCHPDDTFNEREGRVLSFERAFEHLRIHVDKGLKQHQKDLERIVSYNLTGISKRFDAMMRREEL